MAEANPATPAPQRAQRCRPPPTPLHAGTRETGGGKHEQQGGNTQQDDPYRENMQMAIALPKLCFKSRLQQCTSARQTKHVRTRSPWMQKGKHEQHNN